jgi:hypothetical protein
MHVSEFEKNIALKARKNSKAFYKYVNHKVKTRRCTANLTSDNGEFLNDNGQNAEAFNGFFAVAFTCEDVLNVPAVVSILFKI